MNLIPLFAAVAASLALADSATAEFVGRFELRPAGCEQQGQCTLTFDLKYVDPNGVGWQAAAQNQTDGASIPLWARPFIGSPFDPSYIKAAVIHDHYCDRHVRSWRATHKVFYDALQELGVSTEKAKLMYYAVYLGGPKWVELIPGRSCGANCVFEVEVSGPGNAAAMEFEVANEAGGAAEMTISGAEGDGGVMIISRGARYDEPGFVEELRAVESLLQAQGEDIDLDFLERRAKDKRPNDFFYENESRIELEGGFAFQ